MSSLKADFKELIERIKHGRTIDYGGFEPVYYLIFPPEKIIDVKRMTSAWVSLLENEGWKVNELSIFSEIKKILDEVPEWRKKMWSKVDPLKWNQLNEALRTVVVEDGKLLQSFKNKIEELSSEPGSLILVTDLEALHPLTRIGQLESELIGLIKVPLVILYPGIRSGESRLKFLGFYPEDGNYRSSHIGG
jgi:hypothetical protein